MLLRALAALALSVSLGGPVSAQTSREPGSQGRGAPAKPADSQSGAKGDAETTRRPSTLDDLFARLAAAKDETEAKGVAGLIERRFGRSGSDTADLLMSRAGEALSGKDAPLAIELLDRVTQLRPEWAEAWHRRAAAFFMLDDPADALADLNKALTQEPRHFGAWMALGHIRMSSGDKRRALEAYRKALALHPFLEGIKPLVDRIAPEIDGRDL